MLQRPEIDYEDLSSRFHLENKKDHSTRQFNDCYFSRLTSLRPRAAAQAAKLWRGGHGKGHQAGAGAVATCAKIINVSATMKDCYVVGTVYKYVKAVPTLLQEFSASKLLSSAGGVGFKWEDKRYSSDEDYVVLEDETGRLKLSFPPETSKEMIGALITGVVIAVRGHLDGVEFAVSDLCYSSIATIAQPVPNPTSSVVGPHVLLVSGLKAGASSPLPGHMSAYDLLCDWISAACLGSQQDQALAASISRVVLCGNSLDLQRAGHVSHDWDVAKHKQQLAEQTTVITECLSQLDLFLWQTGASCNVDVMSGPSDATNYELPQQPMQKLLFTKAGRMSTVHFVPNPYEFRAGMKCFLGTAGQNIDHIMRLTTFTDRLSAIRALLQWNHLSPMSPDTLGCYPFDATHGDPMTITQPPNVLFAGNQPEFATELITTGEGVNIRVILVPDFAKTGSVVLVNLSTLEATPISFNC